MMWHLMTRSGLYLDEHDNLTKERAEARLFERRALALKARRLMLRQSALELRMVEALEEAPREQRPQPLTPAQERALELIRKHGALRCIGRGRTWRPLEASGPQVAPITVRSLVRRGELEVTAEDEQQRWHQRWFEVRARKVAV